MAGIISGILPKKSKIQANLSLKIAKQQLSRLSALYKVSSDDMYCIDHVRKFDKDFFVPGLLLPSHARSPYFAIRALNIEISRIPAQAKNEHLAHMRFNFWREVIDKVYRGGPIENPIARTLSAAVHKYGLTRRWFDRILEARETDLDSSQPGDIIDLEFYGENTVSSMLYLMLEVLGIDDINADAAASYLGKSLGILILLRGTRFHIEEERCYIPADVMRVLNADTIDLFQKKLTPEIKSAIYETANVAHVHYLNCKKMIDEVPQAARPVLLPAAIAEHILNLLRKGDFDILNPSIFQASPLPLQFKLLYNRIKGVY